MRKRNLLTSILCLITFYSSYTQEKDSVVSLDTIKKIVPTDILFKKSQNHNYSISPNGKYFAEIVSTFSENDIHIIDIDEYIVYKTIPLRGKSIDNLYWITDKRLIYESLGSINAIDIDGSNSSTIVSSFADKPLKGFYSFYKNFRYNSIVNLLPDNKKEILIETFDTEGYASLKRVNVFTGQKITVINGKKHKINKWITDLHGTPQLGIRADGNEIKYLEYSSDDNKFEQFNVRIDDVDYPLIIKPNSYLEQNLSYEAFGFNPNIIYLTSNINSDKRKLIKYNISEAKIEDVILEDINCDVNDPHGKGIQIIFDGSTKEVFGVKYDNLIPKFKWLSIEFDSFQNKLNKNFPGFINDIIDFDEKGEKFVIHQWNDNKSGNIGIYDTTDETYDIMFYFNKELNEYSLSKTKVVIAKTRDEFKLPCYLNLPIDFKDDYTFPMVVIPHGGPWSRDYFEFDKYSQYFASRGYAVLRVNFRGSTGFGKKHVLSGVNSIDGIMINDIVDSVNYFADKHKIDKRKLFIFGHSYGGYATYMSLIKYPEIFASGVALAAPTDIKKWMKTKKREKDYFTFRFWEKVLGNRKSKYLDKISPINFIDDIKKPLLIFHGKRDKTISVNQAEEMISALRDNGKDAKLEILQNEGHTFYDSNGLGYILDSADEFFKKAMDKIE